MRFSLTFLGLALFFTLPLAAQFGPPPGPPADPKAGAPIDMTGYWVSLVTEDWRYRMVTPRPGDYYSVPMTPAAVKLADAWDPAKDEAAGEQCKSYGAPAIMRVPEHLHITWQDNKTMRMETDAGKQTRLFHFGHWTPASNAASLQGDSVAEWEMQREGRKVVNGSLKVTTTHMTAGYLRKNGVPYSANAKLEEFYDMTTERNGDVLLVVTSIVTDPMYLTQPFIVNEQFKKVPDDKGWEPAACSSKW